MTSAADAGSRSPHGTRTKARKRALDILFECDLRASDLTDTLQERIAQSDPPVREFTAQLVRGVARHRLAIDQRIAESLAQEWTLERMARVDRALCQIAVYEMDYTATAPAVIIAEATGLAAELSTDSSPAFVNGVLAAALRNRELYDAPATEQPPPAAEQPPEE